MPIDRTAATKRLAEWMGWEWMGWILDTTWVRMPDGADHAFEPFDRLDDIALVEAEIRRRGADWESAYVEHLASAVVPAWVLDLITATAAQRAEAAWRTVEEMEG